MNRNIVTIILALMLIAGFFLPLSSSGGSAFDIVKGASGSSGESQILKYLWLVMPISGAILLIGAMNNNNYIGGRSLWSILPFLVILYVIIINPLIKGADAGSIFSNIGRGYGTGMWLFIIGSVVLAFYRPKY